MPTSRNSSDNDLEWLWFLEWTVLTAMQVTISEMPLVNLIFTLRWLFQVSQDSLQGSTAIPGPENGCCAWYIILQLHNGTLFLGGGINELVSFMWNLSPAELNSQWSGSSLRVQANQSGCFGQNGLKQQNYSFLSVDQPRGEQLYPGQTVIFRLTLEAR